MRVLLAEDNELNALLAMRILGHLNIDVVHVEDGEEAVARLEQDRFDAVLMDCRMPNMDGYEATRTIRARERAQGKDRMPIIAVTANALTGDMEKCLESGMDLYLAKPYSVEQLSEILDAAVQLRAARVKPVAGAGAGAGDG
jgi:CheY-like chemotaxis protein